MSEQRGTRRLRDIILDQCEAKNLKLEELSKRTGIPEAYLDALINDLRGKLPALPYLRPYLLKMADLLGLPPEQLIEIYKKEFADKISGASDQLPGNRFALPPARRRYLIGIGVLLFIAVLYIIGRNTIASRAHLTIDNPPAGKDPYVTGEPLLTIRGSIDPGNKLQINGAPVATDAEGAFAYDFILTPEINVLQFTVRKFLGQTLTIERQVYYEASAVPPPAEESAEEPAPEPESSSEGPESL